MTEPHDPLSLPEEIVVLDDPETQLEGVVVLHSTRLGPAGGGCRLWRYASQEEALGDALRLARGMTYKNALAGLPLGGGKAVIREPRCAYDRAALFRAFGRAVAKLEGRYVTAEDVGTSVEDMAYVAENSGYVAGLAAKPGLPGGDPSPWTALGVFRAMEVAVQRHLGGSLSGATVGVQGLGHVGFALCELLYNAGAKIIVAEPRSDALARAIVRFDAEPMSADCLLSVPMDIFAPCALGGVLDLAAVEGLRAKIVCGAANNQLSEEAQAGQLARRGILYAPDFLVNAGGIINVAGEYFGWNEEEVRRRVENIGPRFSEILNTADARSILPVEAAAAVARERICASSDVLAA